MNQQIRDHDHIDQRQNHPHDDGFVQTRDLGRVLVANALNPCGQCVLVAKCGLNQVPQLDPKVKKLNGLCCDQAEVEREL
jgi:hypothetical protein